MERVMILLVLLEHILHNKLSRLAVLSVFLLFTVVPLKANTDVLNHTFPHQFPIVRTGKGGRSSIGQYHFDMKMLKCSSSSYTTLKSNNLQLTLELLHISPSIKLCVNNSGTGGGCSFNFTRSSKEYSCRGTGLPFNTSYRPFNTSCLFYRYSIENNSARARRVPCSISKMADDLHNYRKLSRQRTLIEVGTQNKLKYHMNMGISYITHIILQKSFIQGLGFCFLFLVFGITGIYSSVKRRNFVKRNSQFFQKNGGLLLEKHNNASVGGSTKLFTSKELKLAVGYYQESHIFGSGGDSGIERFIKEVIILTQVRHQNVAKFIGCCLETESPILVYELISNGTLSDHIHCRNVKSPLPWGTLLKIASESASAIAYLHSASVTHGNVNSSNILLTDSFEAKICGFGPSRLVPSSESEMSTLLKRTLGYLDPEYLHRGYLTDKSDVYSFGMVLLEILTGQKPISFGRPESQRIMSSHFVFSMELHSGIFDPIAALRVVKEGDREQVRALAELAKRCLKLSSAERPTMEEVAREIKRWLAGSS